MSKDFEERWGFAPDSDYEIRKTNRPVDYMETELKWFNDEGLEYLLHKNEENIEAIKAVNAAILEEIERRKCAA